jgi:translation initiation factor 1A
MPNLTGGKKYKAGKHDTSTKVEFHEIDTEQGQMVGRIIKGLGDRNMLIYCNDAKERIAHIRGGLRKKVARLEIGDIVLISLRGEGMNATQGSIMDKADILAKYEREVYRQLKQVEGINPKLFVQVEIMDSKQRSSTSVAVVEDCGFDMDAAEEEDEGEEGEEGEEGDVKEEELSKEERMKKKVAEEQKRSNARNTKQRLDDDIDIDAL